MGPVNALMCICLCMSMCACMPACLHACMPACIRVCLHIRWSWAYILFWPRYAPARCNTKCISIFRRRPIECYLYHGITRLAYILQWPYRFWNAACPHCIYLALHREGVLSFILYDLTILWLIVMVSVE